MFRYARKKSTSKNKCYYSKELRAWVHKFESINRTCVCGKTTVPKREYKFGKLYYEKNFGLVRRTVENETR